MNQSTASLAEPAAPTRLSDFEAVRQFNLAFGVKVADTQQPNMFEEDPKTVAYRVSLIVEEHSELLDAVDQNSLVEVADALADIVYVVHGMACTMGIDLHRELRMGDDIDNPSDDSDYQMFMAERLARGSIVRTQPVFDIFDSHPDELLASLDRVTNNVEMLSKAVLEQSFVGLTFTLAALIEQAHEVAFVCGINLEKAFDNVHQSNMSKMADTEEDAKATVEWYLARPELGYLDPAYRLTPDGQKYVIYNQSTKKILKCYKYRPADLAKVLNDQLAV